MDNLSEYIGLYAPLPMEPGEYSDIYLGLIQRSMKGTDAGDLLLKSANPVHGYNDIYAGYPRIALSRLLNSAAALYVRGIEPFSEEIWAVLMESLLKDIAADHEKNGTEFSVLEICQALISYGNDDGRFTGYLEGIDPYEKYHSTLGRMPADGLHNFCMYGICAEYLRSIITGKPADEFIERHWEVQRERFNERGMYMDPDCPYVYDITSRYRLALMLSYGYEGSAAGEMREVLLKGADSLMFGISSDYKFPFGGRSNQYQFNEALLASMCEYYCHTYLGEDPTKAGMFRRCAGRCIRGLDRWMEIDEPRHIKNMFPADSGYGTDSYGSYNSYMTSTGSFITGALMLSTGLVTEYEPPCAAGGYVYYTGGDFHGVFASAGGYSTETDLYANPKYDATGLGRIHLTDAPCELALSMPFPAGPGYLLAGRKGNPGARSIGIFWKENGERIYLAENGTGAVPVMLEQDKSCVRFMISYEVQGRGNITEEYSLSPDGVLVSYSSDFADIGLCVPVLLTNGDEHAKIEESDGQAIVSFHGYIYSIYWDKGMKSAISDKLLYNRNGIYRELDIEGHVNSLKVKFIIQRSGR